MIIGLGIGIPFIRNYISSIFDPSKLFTGNTNGVWYDPSDINLTWRRNLLTYSEQFDNAVWTKFRVNTTGTPAWVNVATAPDGTLTSDKLIASTDNNTHYIASITAFTTQSTITVYAKAGEYSRILLGDGSGTSKSISADLSNGTLYNIGGGIQSSSISSEGNGWYRISFTLNSGQGVFIFIIDAAGNISYTGDGTSGIYIWGAQLELGSTATPYQRITDGVQDYLQYQAQPVLYQNAAGTTPVTAVEQPVGLMLDKSKGLVLGPELVTNGDFSNGTTGWGNNSNIATTFEVVSHDGKTNALHVITPASNGGAVQANSFPTVNGVYSVTYDIKVISGTVYFGISTNKIGGDRTAGNSGSWTTVTVLVYGNGSNTTMRAYSVGAAEFYVDNISVRELPGNHAFNGSGNSANFPVLSARYNQYLSTETLTTQNVTTVAANYTLSFTGTGSIALSGTATGTYSAGTHTITCTAGTLTSTVSGTVTKADLRVANDGVNLPAYQRVNTSTDYDSSAVWPRYLRFNGTNQWLQTNSIDFSYGDKMFVSAGVRILGGGVATKFLLESGSSDSFSTPNTFAVMHGYSSIEQYAFRTHGSGAAADVLGVAAIPITNVLSGIGNISAPSAIIRLNGVQTAVNNNPQGTGNFGNYPLYLGAHAGTSLWFNGRLYGMVVAGKQASAAEITSTETYLNNKTGAYA